LERGNINIIYDSDIQFDIISKYLNYNTNSNVLDSCHLLVKTTSRYLISSIDCWWLLVAMKAYRIEPMVIKSSPLKPVLMPHHKGRKRLHLGNVSRLLMIF